MKPATTVVTCRPVFVLVDTPLVTVHNYVDNDFFRRSSDCLYVLYVKITVKASFNWKSEFVQGFSHYGMGGLAERDTTIWYQPFAMDDDSTVPRLPSSQFLVGNNNVTAGERIDRNMATLANNSLARCNTFVISPCSRRLSVMTSAQRLHRIIIFRSNCNGSPTCCSVSSFEVCLDYYSVCYHWFLRQLFVGVKRRFRFENVRIPYDCACSTFSNCQTLTDFNSAFLDSSHCPVQ